MGKYATAATVSFSNQLAALATTFHTQKNDAERQRNLGTRTVKDDDPDWRS